VPILELARHARTRKIGDVVELWATDAAVEKDLKAWCAATGHALLDLVLKDGVYRARIRL
jgi:TusA-related sulfurtransferase